MDCTKEVIMRGLTHAIRNCNRNIYEWMEKSKRGSTFTISHTEVRGLVKNWIIRSLKDTMGNIQADRVLRVGNLYVSVDDIHNCIGFISLSSTDEWRSVHRDVELVKECMTQINYKALRYDPKDYLLDGLTPVSMNYGHPANIDLSSIEKIKF